MNASPFQSIAWDGKALKILDQLKLPAKEVYLEATDSKGVAAAIRDMNLRGAPLIGCAAAYGMVLAAREGEKGLERGAKVLKESRPTAVALNVAVDRMLDAAGRGENLELEASRIVEEDQQSNTRMAELGAALLKNKGPVLTVCNTGALATTAVGTALGVITRAWRDGTVEEVYACETRPYLQGSRLTMWECAKLGLPATLITDGMAGHLMRTQRITAVLAGADRIAANGDTANKIGTYGLAVLAKHHNIPFYIVAPTPTLDFDAATGDAIPIEQRSVEEVVKIGGRSIAPKGSKAWHPAFDVTPHELIQAIVTEKGVVSKPDAAKMKFLAPES